MDRDEAFRRRVAETVTSETAGDSSDDESTYVVRDGMTRSVDADDVSSSGIDSGESREFAEPQSGGRFHSIDARDLDPTLDRPPDFDESLDVATGAPDGTAIGGRGSFTSPTGESVGGSGLSDAIQGRAGELGGDALGRGIAMDPTAAGTEDSRGGAGSADPGVDAMIMGRDGSLYSADPDDDLAPGDLVVRDGDGNVVFRGNSKDFEPTPSLVVTGGEDGPIVIKDFVPEPQTGGPVVTDYDNPDGDSGDSGVTVGGANANLERVRVMEDSRGQPTNNPDDPGTGTNHGTFVPPDDLVTRPAAEDEGTGTTLTPAATLGSSPVVNPTDPVLGDDGIVHGSYSGGSGSGSGGGGEVMPTGMGAADSGGGAPEAQAWSWGASNTATREGELDTKMHVNGASVDMVTGQVIGAAASASGGLPAADGAGISHGEVGDEDEGVQSFAGSDATMAIGAPDGGLLPSGPVDAPSELDGPTAMGDEGAIPGGEG